MKKYWLLLLVLLALSLVSYGDSIRYWIVSKPKLEAALKAAPQNNSDREAALETSFNENGCTGEHLQHQQVKGHLSNLICEIPGTQAGVIVVGAHFDHAEMGTGIVDNWSGAVLLPLLARSVASIHPRHTYRFIAFTDEEKGLIGSTYYVSHLHKEEKKQILAMINFDTLGLAPTEIWLDHGDRALAQHLASVAAAVKLPVSVMNVEQVGTTDSDPFFNSKIPALTIHSVTQETFPILHTLRDNLSPIKIDDYFDTYRLSALFLSYLDQTAGTPELSADDTHK